MSIPQSQDPNSFWRLLAASSKEVQWKCTVWLLWLLACCWKISSISKTVEKVVFKNRVGCNIKAQLLLVTQHPLCNRFQWATARNLHQSRKFSLATRVCRGPLTHLCDCINVFMQFCASATKSQSNLQVNGSPFMCLCLPNYLLEKLLEETNEISLTWSLML